MALIDGFPAGMFQHYRIRDDPEYAQALALGEDAIGVDLFIGEPELIGHGHGPKMLGAFLRKVAMPFHRQDVCVIGPSVSNVAAIGLYAAEGFKPVGRRESYYPALAEGMAREDALVMRRPVLVSPAP